jgi:cytochrome c556
MSKRLLFLLVAVLALGVTAAGCGNDEKATTTKSSSSSMSHSDMGKTATTSASDSGEGVESGSAELRAGLTALLEEHVYLAGIAVVNGVGNGLDSGEFKAAAATLDTNSKGLAEAITSVYGDDAGKQFLALWRKHIGFFVTYTKGLATKNPKLAAKAQKQLDGYRTDFGAFIASANPNLPADAVAAELKPHVASLSAAIRSVVKGNTNAFAKLKKAAGHMPMTAKVLAGGIAKQYPDKFSGNSDSGASELRSGLTGLLEEHVYLAGIAVTQGVGEGLDSKQFKAAAAALDTNSKGLAAAIKSVYGADAGKQFLALWRKHIGFFVTYTKGLATKDAALAAKAQKQLDGYRTDFGAFIASANPNLPADAVAEELKPHVASLSAAIRSVVKGKGDAFDKLKAAADHMPMTAKVLAGGIAKQYPDKFPAS